MIGVALGVVGVLLLAMFFKAVESKWPQSYMAVGDIVSFRISTTPARYVLFRLAPVFVVAFLVSATLIRGDREANVGLILLGVGHFALSSGRDLLETLLKRRGLASQTMRIIVDSVVGVGIAVAVIVGGLIARIESLQTLVPSLNTITITFWTALFAAVGGAFLVKATGTRELNTEELAKASARSLPEGLLEYADQIATKNGRDPALGAAVMLAENLQRPGWVRRLERVKGSILQRGSYGVMQVQADAPIDDRESVRRAVTMKLPSGDLWIAGEGPNDSELVSVLHDYNPDPGFVNLAKDFYHQRTQHRWEDETEDIELEADDEEGEG